MSAVRFQLLGPLSITDGGETVVLHPSKPANLLAALLLNAGAIVSVDYLQRMVWGDEQPATARAALQTCVLRLRRLFAKHEVVDTPIEAVPGGYRITADARFLDLVEFRELVRGTQEPAAGLSAEAALGALQGALALWQTGVLANVRSEAIHRDEVPRLLEERLRVVERLCDLRLELGQCGPALVDLWSVTRAHPDHGRFREQLIEALYRTGRQTEALAEYRRFKAYLADGLGVGPSAALQRLELSILRGEDLGPATEPPARAALPAAEPAAPAPVPDPPGLPPVPWFTGRAEAVATLRRRLAAEPDGSGTPVAELVCGGPGIGKTALARQVAHLVRDHFPGGQALVPMAAPDGSPRGAAEVIAEIAGRLGESHSGARALLLLDDVVDAAQARDVLSAVPGHGVLVTSRLGLAGLVATHGVRVHRLGALPAAEARELLAAVLGAERVAEEPGGAEELAEVCGHHPLALVIAAARLGTRPALRLGDCARWLADDPLGRLSLSGHPRMSVVELLDAALDRLDPELARAYAALGALGEPGWDAADCAAVLGLPLAECEAVLERLADAGLLEDGPRGPYHPHPLLRLHARLVAGRAGGSPPRRDRPGGLDRLDGPDQPGQSGASGPSGRSMQSDRTSQPKQKV